MPSVFQPLSEIAPEALVEYLGREGNSPETVRWKYFDERFNRGRERGYAWVNDGKIGGFVGLVPFQIAFGDHNVDAAWSCDWSVQDSTGRGTGILLIRQAMQNYPLLAQLGGNHATQRIISRMASITVNDAGMVFHLPLRIGAILRLARRRYPRFPVDASQAINRLPLRWPHRPKDQPRVIIEPGVSEVLVDMIVPSRHGAIYSHYDLDYLRWQLTDCPFVTAETFYVPGPVGPRAAALVWRQANSPDFWRMAVWLGMAAAAEMDAVLTKVIDHVFQQKGYLLSIVVSRMETDLIGLLRKRHFIAAPRRRPLHIIAAQKTELPVPELWPLSYLDTDYAYRF
jgi:hypothetical protein